jgi:hypothetical protein
MATKEKDNEYICTLSEKFIKQAEEELFETHESRTKNIKILREKIENCQGMNFFVYTCIHIYFGHCCVLIPLILFTVVYRCINGFYQQFTLI